MPRRAHHTANRTHHTGFQFIHMSSHSPSATSTAPASGTLFWLLLPFALAYGVSYFFRNVNAVAGPVLAQEFSVGPGGLGFLTSVYFLAFALGQVPLGIALDRFGPARVNAVMLLASATGAAVFALASDVSHLGAGRALIGLGSGAALMSAMSAAHLWVPQERRATSMGFIMLVGGVGALTASTPVQILISNFGWRNLFWVLCGLALVVSVLVWRTRGAVRPAAGTQTPKQLLAGVAEVFSSRFFWTIAAAVMLTLGTMLAFQSLWAATWMRDVAGMSDRIEIGNVLFAFNLGMACAFFGSGWLGDALERGGIAPERTLIGYMAVAMAAQVWLMLWPQVLPHLAWGMYSFGANALVLAFSILPRRFAPALTGRVNTALNLLAFGTAFLLQWGIGVVLNLWPVVDGRYAAQGYYRAWIVLVLLQLAAAIWLAFATRRRAVATRIPATPES